MKRGEKRLAQLAIALHQQLTTQHSSALTVDLPTAAWRQCEKLLSRMRRARERGWSLAAGRLQGDLQHALGRLHGELDDVDRVLTPLNETRRPAIRDVYADLRALNEEFDEVGFDLQERTISVTTEPIELDSFYLGPFEIRLDWASLGGGDPFHYRIIALDAQPSAANESVTHPHVQDEALCEGEGRQPIRSALEQCRLLDFFLVVANLLRTYNSESPYVALSEWRGVECSDCGSNVCDDERWCCEKCGSSVCGECVFHCPGCECVYCASCVTLCEGCDQYHCRGCMSECARCSADICRGCLNENERCASCEKEIEEVDDESEQSCDAGAPLHANGVGQAAVPA